MLLAFGLPPVIAQEAGATALEAVLEIERSMLDEARARYESLSRRRVDLLGEIELLRDALDDAVREQQSPDARRLHQIAEQLERAEADRSEMLLTERLLIDRIAQHLERLELFEQQVASVQADQEQTLGPLSGSWDLVLMPSGQRGSAALQQTGAVVNGTYQLEGGWTGSLQGTLVKRKVFLVRIDSKLGKSMEFEGFLSSDRKRIRGSWLNYELAGGDGATGQWTAQRRGDPGSP
jgi:hypothetical protein